MIMNLMRIDFYCDEEHLASGRCIFHDNHYLHDKTNNDEHKRTILDRLKRKVKHAISNNESLLCIGFKLQDFSLSHLSVNKVFTKSVYFCGSHLFGKAFLTRSNFQRAVFFSGAHLH